MPVPPPSNTSGDVVVSAGVVPFPGFPTTGVGTFSLLSVADALNEIFALYGANAGGCVAPRLYVSDVPPAVYVAVPLPTPVKDGVELLKKSVGPTELLL